jgi:hypothetical protein
MTLPDCLDALSYDVHTNHELEFMLERGKPLAHFSDAHPAEPDEEIFPEQAFSRYVWGAKAFEVSGVRWAERPSRTGQLRSVGRVAVIYSGRIRAGLALLGFTRYLLDNAKRYAFRTDGLQVDS